MNKQYRDEENQNKAEDQTINEQEDINNLELLNEVDDREIIADLVQYAATGEPAAFQDTFQFLIDSRINGLLKHLRDDVAARVMGEEEINEGATENERKKDDDYERKYSVKHKKDKRDGKEEEDKYLHGKDVLKRRTCKKTLSKEEEELDELSTELLKRSQQKIKDNDIDDGEYFQKDRNRLSGMIKKKLKEEDKQLDEKNWIADAIKHKGSLHRELGVPEGKKIPEDKIKAAEHSKNATFRKRARLADTLKGLRK